MSNIYTIDNIETQFNIFLKNNPESRVEMHKTTEKGGDEILIVDLWADKTIGVSIPEDSNELSTLSLALNSIYFPKRLSAIIHVDTSELEVIWTAFKVGGPALDVIERSFVFEYEGMERVCRFAQSSDRLLTLARHVHFRTNPSSTEHRNLLSFHLLQTLGKDEVLDIPRSFFVDCSGLDETAQLDLVAQLNAYMLYFDRKTPKILIHEQAEYGEETRRKRYSGAKFPERIVAHSLDANLVSFWTEMITTANPFMRLLLGYRIIEYAAFNFLEAGIRSKIRRVIASPDVKSDIDRVAARVAEIIGIGKEIDKIPRSQMLVSATVDLNRLWLEIDSKRDFFRNPMELDGGFSVKALLVDKDTFETWSNNGVRNTLDRLREIRNALSHGQDGVTRSTIQPTKVNAAKIVPWVNLVEIIAGDVMLYRDIV